MRDAVRKQAEEGVIKLLPYYLQHDSFEIQSEWFPEGKSLELTTYFFNNRILPLHTTPNPHKIDQKLKDFCCLAANLSYSSSKRPLMVPLGSNV
jgi:hypothetical protein